jgi:hypothetical protein
MRELSKRWARVARAPSDGGVAWVLREKDAKWNWAHIQRDQILSEWELRIWGGSDWGKPISIPTLRAAKALGRVLAATATR